MAKLKPNFAFRPFWRTTNKTAESSNQWNQPKPGAANDVYFYPGERFSMSLRETGKDKLKLDIGLEGSPTRMSFGQEFVQQGFGRGLAQSFKRVSSIDQFGVMPDGTRKGRENLPVLSTQTTALGGGFDEVKLLLDAGKTRPMRGSDATEVRSAELTKRYDAVFRRSGYNVNGGERIDIVPSGK